MKRVVLVTALVIGAIACQSAPAPAVAPTPSTAVRDSLKSGYEVVKANILKSVHDAEHYGNIVTYLRLNNMVPPSSQPRPQ